MNRRAVYGALLAFLVAVSVYAVELIVQGNDVSLLSSPDPMADAVGTLALHQVVTSLGTQAGYTQVRTADGKQGWVATSVLKKKGLLDNDLMAGKDDAKKGVTEDEAAAATPGMTKPVEDAFKTQNPNLSFTEVDRIEKLGVTKPEIKAFIKEGALAPSTGGAK
jgi:hypothetical protein